MKAQTFLEWYQSAINRINTEFKDIGFGFAVVKDFLNKLHNLSKLYSQTFKPDMITGFFEGWEKVEGYNGVYAYKWDEQYSIINAEHTLIIDDTYISIDTSKFRLPKTLDSFKTLLEEQAGIELVWKEEIERKYFV